MNDSRSVAACYYRVGEKYVRAFSEDSFLRFFFFEILSEFFLEVVSKDSL